MDQPKLTTKDVEEKKQERWIIYKGKVYALSEDFVKHEHPGGYEILEPVFGTDITSTFKEYGHSKFAKNLMKQFLVGKLSTCQTSE